MLNLINWYSSFSGIASAIVFSKKLVCAGISRQNNQTEKAEMVSYLKDLYFIASFCDYIRFFRHRSRCTIHKSSHWTMAVLSRRYPFFLIFWLWGLLFPFVWIYNSDLIPGVPFKRHFKSYISIKFFRIYAIQLSVPSAVVSKQGAVYVVLLEMTTRRNPRELLLKFLACW